MDSRKLRYFCAVAEEKHFGRAAERLSISQPPLSLSIMQLEAEIGAKLLDRNSRNVALTKAGEALYREASSMLHRMDQVRTLVRGIGEGKDGWIRIGFGGSMLYRGLPTTISALREAFPTVELLLRELNTVEQIEAFKHNEIDFGFALGRQIPEGLDGCRYHSEPFVACLPASHPEASSASIRLDKLRDEQFILFAQAASPNYHRSIVESCQSAGFTPRISHEVRHWMSAVSFVAHGIGVSLVPSTLVRSNLSNVAFIPLKGSTLKSETWCVWNGSIAKDSLLTRAAQVILAHAPQRSSDRLSKRATLLNKK